MAAWMPIAERYRSETEEDRVVAWRLSCLLDAGYRVGEAELIACQLRIDLHQALELVLAGCPPALAARILL
jgi:hypothetical protein